MNLWKKISLFLLISIILLLGILIFLLNTTAGLNILFNATSYWIPGIKIEQITGSWQNINLKNIHYQQSGVIVSARAFHLALNFNCIRESQFCVNDLSIDDLNVIIDSKKITSLSASIKKYSNTINLSMPYPLVLYKATLSNINIKIDDANISIINFISGFRWQKNNLTIMPTSLKGLFITLPKSTNITDNKIIKFGEYNQKLQKKLFDRALKNFLSRPILYNVADMHLPINLNIEEFKGDQIQLVSSIDFTIFDILLKMNITNNNVYINALNINSNQGSINATGKAWLHDNWPVSISLKSYFNIKPLEEEILKIRINGFLFGRLELNINLVGPLDMMIYGTTQFTKIRLPLKLKINSKHYIWFFTKNKQFQADHIKIKLNGKMNNYILTAFMSIKKYMPIDIITLINSIMNKQLIKLDKFSASSVLEGEINLIAPLINWRRSISWSSTLKFIDIKNKFSNWPYSLDGFIKICGNLYQGTWQIDIPEIRLNGKFKHSKFKINGSLKGSRYLNWVIPGIHIALNKNTMDIRGAIRAQNLDLNAVINAPNLDDILSGLKGIVKGLIKVRGTVKAPQLLTDIVANSLQWQNLSIARIHLDGKFQYNEQISGRIYLFVKRIIRSDLNINRLTLVAKGKNNKHDLQFKIFGKPVSGQLHLIGSFTRQLHNWRGYIDNTRFNTPVGLLSLSHYIKLEYYKTEQKIRISPHCWTSSNAELCLSNTIATRVAGRVMLHLKHLNLAIFKSFMPYGTQASGVLSGKVIIVWNINKKELPKAIIILSGNNVKIIKIINKLPLTLAFNIFQINANISNNSLKLSWLIQLTNNGHFNGQIQINDLQNQCVLNGTFIMHKFTLAMINIILSHGEKVTGLLNSNLQLTGNLSHPQLFGYMHLKNLNIESDLIPFGMQPSQIIINFKGIHSTLSGVVHTLRGQININGEINYRYINNCHMRVTVKGSCIRISLSPTMQLDVSPNVVFEFTPNLLIIYGSVDLPWAYIVMRILPASTVSISSDEVLLNKNLKPIEQKSINIQMNTNLIVHIGNNVKLDAFGLKTKLTGNLKIIKNKQGLGLNGQINLPEGHFHAYGQDLIMRKGELLFSGPLDQLLLNIEAIRNPDTTEDNVIVGVRITGSIDEMRAEVFSNPVMSQQEALSYLLHGQGLRRDKNSNLAMTSMLVSLGVAQSEQILGKIGKTFGVNNLSLDAQGIGDSSQIVISGYLLPDLQIKYGIGIFDSLVTLTLRYRLMPKLYVEAISKLYQSLDLLYQFDF